MEKTVIRRRVVSLLSILLFIGLFIFLFFAVGRPLIQFVEEPEQFRAWLDSYGVWGRVIFLGMTLLQIIIGIIPGEPLEIGAGYAFGFWEGFLLCELGILIGSALIWCFSRYLGIKAVEAFYPREKLNELKFLKDSKKLNITAFILFFIPGTPKDMLTYVLGLTPMKLSTCLFITVVARIPSVITSVIGGSALGEQNYLLAIIVFAVTGLISLCGILYYNRKYGKKTPKE
ncbi:MAG: TVP38/TMEM64 family protein [Clostridia bacterium]|nr:TVP38/TMEM64 family protein [Clostridia bacterium]